MRSRAQRSSRVPAVCAPSRGHRRPVPEPDVALLVASHGAIVDAARLQPRCTRRLRWAAVVRDSAVDRHAIATGVPWWRSAVVYQIYPRSFADSDGDGVGDLDGIRSRLDYVAGLGVDAVWLSPIYESPMADLGYDVSDHTAIDPVFGDLSAFDRSCSPLTAAGYAFSSTGYRTTRARGIPGFSTPDRPGVRRRRDWYFWRDGRGGGPPNNWRSAFGGPAWTWDEETSQWYLHLFLPEQPDLNWANAEVVEAMHDILRFWLDRGVDGFRADVVHLIGRDAEMHDQPAGVARISTSSSRHDNPRTHELLRDIRRVLEEYRRRTGHGRRGAARRAGAARAVLRRRRRAAHGFRLRPDARALVGRGVRVRDRRGRAGPPLTRSLALLGAVEPRPASPPLPLLGVGAASSRRGGGAPDACAGRPAYTRARSLGCSTRLFPRPLASTLAGATAHVRPCRGMRRPPTAGPPARCCRCRRTLNAKMPRRWRPTLIRSSAFTGGCSPPAASSDALRLGEWRLLDSPTGTLLYERSWIARSRSRRRQLQRRVCHRCRGRRRLAHRGCHGAQARRRSLERSARAVRGRRSHRVVTPPAFSALSSSTRR